ncbi:hypothetical protein VB151_10640 [Xanthomonas fragariae]|uniref:Uncharacterized protein n=1 Tax=Xanthomonas fragariae TaxID=48664 RepID=A0A1Y6GU84_9XANT|nr:hypothetical protein [Xanthomonas fragariae]AOD14535.1 hypothetical protein BER92_07050 [Xanthomonas fragariae]AOD17929.1 hypothetical protein BER93_07065 [Xanthomonas fragariae]ENZ94950.1 hypothetical protein O1K_13491 [Xanthomonas fragariae LMG 25863]MBL9196074.1 hypothetical protein [Xanthomonas fragariae]MBL9220418.1 hypothetical protein [Xanthomonas fragariae]
MNTLPARLHVRACPRIRLSGALAFGLHALAFHLHRSAPAATVGPQRRTRTLSAFTPRALELRAADTHAALQGLA